MKQIGTRLLQASVILLTLGLMFFAVFSYHGNLLASFEEEGRTAQTLLASRAGLGLSFIETMSSYGEAYLRNEQKSEMPFLQKQLTYDPATDLYSLDSFENTGLQSRLGNLIGRGRPPTSGEILHELDLVFSLNSFFTQIYARVPEISRIYYTSESGFQNVYPWVHSRDYAYSDALLEAPFYVEAGPGRNPFRRPVWVAVPAGTEDGGKILSLSAPIYADGVLRGVVTIDYPGETLTDALKNQRCQGVAYLVDKDFSVVAAPDGKGMDLSVGEALGLSPVQAEQLEQGPEEAVFSVGGHFVYKAVIPETPILLVSAVPSSRIVLQSLYLTLPILCVGAFLLITLIILMNLRRAESKLKLASITDALTGLKNRRYLDTVIEDAITRADRLGEKLSLVSLDLDYFKNVNDTWGHVVGDEVLKLVADSIRSQLRQDDVLVRMGGEEFMLLLPGTDIYQAYDVAERIRRVVKETEHPHVGNITVSLGVAERWPGESYPSMYRRVDKAMYAAKLAGRDRVHIYSEALDTCDAGSVMMTAAWNDEWNSGEPEIDSQHQELMVYANELMHLSGSGPELTQDLINLIIAKTADHFAYEEKVLRARDFPEIDCHVREHNRLLLESKLLWEKVQEGTARPQVLFAYLYTETVMRHMLEEDKKYYYLFEEAGHTK